MVFFGKYICAFLPFIHFRFGSYASEGGRGREEKGAEARGGRGGVVCDAQQGFQFMIKE